MRAAVAANVKKLMFLGSSCVFPRNAPQPMTEDLLLTGSLEPTNEWYAVAKIAGIKLAQAYRRQFGVDFISVMPTNLYGPRDNYHPENSHVPAALIRRFHEAKMQGAEKVVVWGTGKPKREFLAADDLGDACIFVMKHYSGRGFPQYRNRRRSQHQGICSTCGRNRRLSRETCVRYRSPRWSAAQVAQTFPSSPRSAGLRRRHCAKACKWLIRIFLAKASTCVSDSRSS